MPTNPYKVVIGGVLQEKLSGGWQCRCRRERGSSKMFPQKGMVSIDKNKRRKALQ